MGLFSSKGDEPVELNVAKPAAYTVVRPLTASAARIDIKNVTEITQLKKRREKAKWQQDALDFYDLIGEVQFSANLLASITSRVRLFAGYVDNSDAPPSNIFNIDDDQVSPELKQAAIETLRKLASGPGGIPGALRDAALNLFIAGECYLVRETPPNSFGMPGPEQWHIRSVDEIVIKDGKNKTRDVYLRESKGDSDEDLVPLGGYGEVYLNRIWRNHPRFSKDADSSMRPQLENCDMLLLYDRSKRGVVKSRLNPGMLFLPDGLSYAAESDGELTDIDSEVDGIAPVLEDAEDAFEEQLMEAMITPISDEGSAASIVPLLVRGPAELGKEIRLIKFERTYDPAISTDHERLLERSLAGLDLPKDVVAGVGSAKYANAVVIEESLYKAHVEPLVLTIVDALTVLLMRPVLKSLGFPDEEIARVVIWYDPSAITTKPDKATAATTGYEMGEISGKAWRRANGFSESDAPSGLERMQRLAQSKGLLNEAVTEATLRTIHPELFDEIRQNAVEQTDPDTVDAVDDALDGTADGSFGQAPSDSEETSDAAPTPQPSSTPPTALIEP